MRNQNAAATLQETVRTGIDSGRSFTIKIDPPKGKRAIEFGSSAKAIKKHLKEELKSIQENQVDNVKMYLFEWDPTELINSLLAIQADMLVAERALGEEWCKKSWTTLKDYTEVIKHVVKYTQEFAQMHIEEDKLRTEIENEEMKQELFAEVYKKLAKNESHLQALENKAAEILASRKQAS